MIHIERISIEKFLGIRELTLDLHRETFGIYGPKWANYLDELRVQVKS